MRITSNPGLQAIPFGAQYYRAPTPERSQWRADMSAMRSAGFNTIKIWAQWRWNQPAEDRFYFDDLDELMDLAGEHGLWVVINTILDCAPAWLYRKFPDSLMLRACGERVGPVTLGHRQIGGAPGPCFHHAEAARAGELFIETVVRRYASHPALLLWDLWNEPELTVGLLRDPRIENLVCYCENSKKAFGSWLESKYGSLDGLNHAWHRNYQDWDELELPTQPHTFTDMVDWRAFFIDTVTGNMETRVRAAKRSDPVHPVMCHTVPAPHFNPITCASDDWALSRCCDLFGNSIGSDPMAADTMRAAARGKTVINAEIHAIPGSTFGRPKPIGMEEMKRHLLVPLAHGIKGFLFWQYRPELLGAESPAWGLTGPDGKAAPWLADASRIGSAITSDSGFFLSAERPTPQVAILTSPVNQVFCWAASGSTRILDQSLAGAYRALYRANYSIDFIHPLDVVAGALEECAVLYAPLPYWYELETLDRIKDWVRDGGHLISECFFAAMDTDRGYHSVEVPGCGFSDVFGIVEGLVYPEAGVFDSYRWRAGGSGDRITFVLDRDVGSLSAGTQIAGFHVGTALVPSGAEVVARFPTGEPAVTIANYGRGTATMVGTMLGAAYAERSDEPAADLIAELVGSVGAAPMASVSPRGKVRVDMLESAGRRWIMLQNLRDEEVDAAVRLAPAPSEPPVEMLTSERATVVDGLLRVGLQPRQIKTFWDG